MSITHTRATESPSNTRANFVISTLSLMSLLVVPLELPLPELEAEDDGLVSDDMKNGDEGLILVDNVGVGKSVGIIGVTWELGEGRGGIGEGIGDGVRPPDIAEVKEAVLLSIMKKGERSPESPNTRAMKSDVFSLKESTLRSNSYAHMT